jgi:hypothetical protein
MAAEIELYQDSPAARGELAAFLARPFRKLGAGDTGHWLRRFSHWWDDNPFASAHSCRGWTLRDKGQLVGYLGVIPFLYEHGAEGRTPALAATSFAIDEGHRHAALAMIAQYQSHGDQCLLIDTTPSAEVRALLRRKRWSEHVKVTRKFLLPPLARRQLPPESGGLHSGRRIIWNPAEARGVAQHVTSRPVQKHVTAAALGWYCASPLRRHDFAGVVDSDGRLTSYLIHTPQRVRGVPAATVVDWFTVRPDPSEVHFLAASLRRPLVSVMQFEGQNCWGGLPCLHEREVEISHFHRLPQHLEGLPRRLVLAEGDAGL